VVAKSVRAKRADMRGRNTTITSLVELRRFLDMSTDADTRMQAALVGRDLASNPVPGMKEVTVLKGADIVHVFP
jgi:hypothetical protein